MPISTKKVRNVVDFSGPSGNAFFLIGTVSDVLKRTGHSPASISLVVKEMKSSDYNNLIATFLSIAEPHFDIVISKELWEEVEPLYCEKMSKTKVVNHSKIKMS